MSESNQTSMSLSNTRVVVLLVDDQAMIGEVVRRMCASHSDIEYHFCSDPMKAVEMATKLEPTVILQDLVMPGIDGLDLVLQYRQNEATKLVPLIVLSSKEEPATKAEAFARGANDYMVKLPDQLEILARLRYHSRGYRALLERNEAFRQLKNELDQAGDYVQSLLPPTIAAPDLNIRGAFIPSAQLGGDFFGWRELSDGNLAMFLIDVCGHGVGPALLSVSVSNALHAGGFSESELLQPAKVMTRLNNAFPMTEHRGMYFTGWYAVLHRPTRRLTWAGAGHPPAIVTRLNGDYKELESLGTPIGIVPDFEYEQSTTTLESGDRLYIYSDGIAEIPKLDGTVWSYSEFLLFVQTDALKVADPIARLLEYTRGLQGTEQYTDDVSIIELKLS
ncbi:MAG: SpoIIE family protein phosphatase [Planctomycetota bacterium]|nr:SpoIIE family protein phosphatase [Planctomycetota bacterium]MDA1262596.1 SpoIIE family protein phosphatase [Planctomycetota bacterium]